MLHRVLPVLGLMFISTTSSSLVSANDSLGSCPVTLANHGAGGRYQNDAIAVGLWSKGKVVFKPNGPGEIHGDGSLEMKFWWWRLRPGRLTIEGRRLDGADAKLRALIPEGYGDVGFQPIGMIFSSAGCWQVTGRLGEDSLTFVTLVERMPA
jgi:hypothetical protein